MPYQIEKKHLTPALLNALPISIGEARKLLNADENSLADEDVAREILLQVEIARMLIKTMDLQ